MQAPGKQGSVLNVKTHDVVVIGNGLVGLANALQLAKRGIQVTLVAKKMSARQKLSYKVGESFLVFTSAFLRTVGGLDDFITNKSFIKLGVWFASGGEYKDDFSKATEWAVNADPHPPHYLYDITPDKKWFRCMFLDMQISRPEAESEMRRLIEEHPNITLLDDMRVIKVDISKNSQAHKVHGRNSKNEEQLIQANWVVDCSGRRRLLAKQLGHDIEEKEAVGEFQTTALWAHFGKITDDCFDERWVHLLQNQQATPRDYYTVHLWGVGYWIWIIRLSDDRLSVGVTVDQGMELPDQQPQDQFWSLINRYPLLSDILTKNKLLQFQKLSKVQHWTDTFIHKYRYAMLGDSASIIDAYYSQGIALAMVTGWHVSNIIQRDIQDHILDLPYIDRVNNATRQDWHILRNTVREKYTVAIEDSRFFLLSHILDMAIFWGMGNTRSKLTRWLVDTEGDTSLETPKMIKDRKSLEFTLFYSKSRYWLFLPPHYVQKIQRHLQAKIAQRARWRIAHGIITPRITSVLNVTAPTPRIWMILFRRGDQSINVSALDLVKPKALRNPDEIRWLDHLPISPNTRLKWVIRIRPIGLLMSFGIGYLWDAADTALYKIQYALKAKSTKRQENINEKI